MCKLQVCEIQHKLSKRKRKSRENESFNVDQVFAQEIDHKPRDWSNNIEAIPNSFRDPSLSTTNDPAQSPTRFCQDFHGFISNLITLYNAVGKANNESLKIKT